MASTTGMMAPAFFVGRSELVAWVNALLDVNISKVEQCASGAIYCQILDAAHRTSNVVPMRRVNFEARSEHEFVANYKILQAVFEKLNIAKNIEVQKLVKARPLDNLEFLQWMKCYYDTATGGGCGEECGSYDAEERRAGARGGASFARRPQATAAPRERRPAVRRDHHARETTTTSTTSERGVEHVRHHSRAVDGANASSSARTRELTEANAALKLQVERAEQEREFYFEKLQDVEFVCQRPEFESNPLKIVIERILYHTDGKADVEAIIAECFAEDTKTEALSATPTPPPTELPSPSPVAVATASMATLRLERLDSGLSASPIGASPLGTPPPMFSPEESSATSEKATESPREPLRDASNAV